MFAEMRTGSNFLEANLNAIEGVFCHGEAFNPHFLGYPSNAPILGIDLETRDRDPMRLLSKVRDWDDGMHGFRYFHDHDPRVFDEIIGDETCAKIILTRNPLESYISWKIARQTGQWKLTNLKSRKSDQVMFDEQEFTHHLTTQQDFQIELQRRLQVSGQTAFYISYEDLQSIEVLNGLARFLGVAGRLEKLDGRLKKQNPKPTRDKVANPEAMSAALSRLDQFNLARTPNFEPQRGPNVPSYYAGLKSRLIFLPIRGAPRSEVVSWLAGLEGVKEADLHSQMTQKELRGWLRKNSGHRRFTVVRHPIARAHDAFCRYILPVTDGSYLKLRKTLIQRYDLPLPLDGPDGSYGLVDHRKAFEHFLSFLKGNLSGQTAVRVDAAWCTQSETLSGFARFCPPDNIIRETQMADVLPALAAELGCHKVPAVPPTPQAQPFRLSQIYDADLEKLARNAYQRDYLMFGFSDWSEEQR